MRGATHLRRGPGAWPVAALLGLLLVAGCGAEPGGGRLDTGPREGLDTGPREGLDTGPREGLDTGPHDAVARDLAAHDAAVRRPDATARDASAPDATAPDARAPDAGTQAPRYLALGDSYTIGESVDPRLRFPEVLAARLAADGQPVAAPEIIARTGWSTAQLAAAVAQADPQGPYPLVTLLVGVNDQFRGGRAADYEPAFRGMLATAVALAGAPCAVVVISIPDYGQTPFGSFDAPRIAAGIDAFNAVARSEATRVGAPWVDITDISRRGLAEPALVARDGLHPSAEQYAEWVGRIAPAAQAALSTCRR